MKGHTWLWMNVLPFYCHLHNRLDWLKRNSLSIKKGSLSIFGLTERNGKIRIRRAVRSSLFRGLSTEGCDLGQQLYLLCIVKLFIFENCARSAANMYHKKDMNRVCALLFRCVSGSSSPSFAHCFFSRIVSIWFMSPASSRCICSLLLVILETKPCICSISVHNSSCIVYFFTINCSIISQYVIPLVLLCE